MDMTILNGEVDELIQENASLSKTILQIDDKDSENNNENLLLKSKRV